MWLRVDQSDLEPMITPTSALIVVPLIGRPQAHLKTTSHAGGPAWLVVRIMTDSTGQRPRSIPQSVAFKAPAISSTARHRHKQRVQPQGSRKPNGAALKFRYVDQRVLPHQSPLPYRVKRRVRLWGPDIICLTVGATLKSLSNLTLKDENVPMKKKLNIWLSLVVFFYLPFASADGPNLGLFLIMHDQLTKHERAELGESYLNPVLAQLQEITGRRTTVTFINNEPGLTDFGYRSEELDKPLYRLSKASIEYANAKNLPRPSERHKYVLVTSNKINGAVHGVTATNYHVAIASLKDYNTLAHEIGHLFGAEHEAATGFPCQTTMWENSTTSIIPCYYFSDANKELIRKYVDNLSAR
ncbi:Uncharacterized protein ALO83_03776 [Pseudomonas cannabina pv. alisalensis]|uniref:Ribosomal protein S8 n=3 Tax=Pseudomonas syringae group TaxID=136849 RepID=A0AB37Q9H4_PSECA|nr:Uncharacterized protein ALO83_03776 [Pseudomonas cannabina pv. alisalensis]RMN81699.1 hypothetical protein ALQ53_04276 [Pseudomonas cannabina]